MDLAKYAGAVIKNLREKNGWTQTDLAKKVGVGKTTIANYESGTRSPNQDMLFKLADVLQVSVNRISLFLMVLFQLQAHARYLFLAKLLVESRY